MLSHPRARYLKSLADEVLSQASRVRNLIGSRHWLSDGHHKEELLRVILRRHSPAGVLWTRGFVLSPSDEDACSKEQDILAIDMTHEAPLFYQGDLAIAFPSSVLAAISVKTTLGTIELSNAVEGLSSVRNVAHGAGVDSNAIWCGAYFYGMGSSQSAASYDSIVTAIGRSPAVSPLLGAETPYSFGPDLVSIADDLLYRLDYIGAAGRLRVRGFQCNGLATSLFIVNLLDHIAVRKGRPTADLAAFAEDCGATCLNPPELVAEGVTSKGKLPSVRQN